MFRFYQSLFVFLPFAPPVLAVLGGIISLRLSRRRWIVHTITFVAMLLALPIYIHFLGVLEPASVQYPGPGDAFVALLYPREKPLRLSDVKTVFEQIKDQPS
jgi:hypothetical protein